MPGLTLMLADGTRVSDNSEVQKAQSLLLHGPHYRIHPAGAWPCVHLGWVGYDEYPVRMFSTAGSQIYLEGRIYNRPANSVEADLAELAASVFDSGFDDAKLRRFTSDNDGSYVVVFVRPETCEVVVFSDGFCRLPLYYSVDDSRLIIAREAKFVHALRLDPGFDRVGCAQLLAFGLPLGERTVLNGVRSFPEAGLLRATLREGHLEWRLQKLKTWNLDEEDRSKSTTRHAREFAELFIDASRTWGAHPDSEGNFVSLSGGHDSRAVAAGLMRSGAGGTSLTYRDPSGKRETEVRYAREVAKALHMHWECIDLPAPSLSSYEKLAWLKDGMNYSYMGYILGYLEEIASRWGHRHTYMSGDGGDDCLKVTAPKLTFQHINDVVDDLLEKETCMRPGQAEAILKLPQGTLRDELRRLLQSYPEEDLSRRIKHFKIFERARRFYFEGEDRARAFLWQDSPFYSMPVFEHCMQVPDRQKYYHEFCRQALIALSPAAAGMPATPAGYAPASWKYALYYRAKATVLGLPAPLVKLTRFVAGTPTEAPYQIPAAFETYLLDELSRDTPLAVLLDRAQVPRGLQDIDEHSFFCFWTVAMLEKAYRARSSSGS